jgi:hypothetical protein
VTPRPARAGDASRARRARGRRLRSPARPRSPRRRARALGTRSSRVERSAVDEPGPRHRAADRPAEIVVDDLDLPEASTPRHSTSSYWRRWLSSTDSSAPAPGSNAGHTPPPCAAAPRQGGDLTRSSSRSPRRDGPRHLQQQAGRQRDRHATLDRGLSSKLQKIERQAQLARRGRRLLSRRFDHDPPWRGWRRPRSFV